MLWLFAGSIWMFMEAIHRRQVRTGRFVPTRKTPTQRWYLYVFVMLAVINLYFSLIVLGFERARLYRPVIEERQSHGGDFHCLHGMCHCR